MEILLIAWLWAMLELGGWFFFSGVFLHKREKNRYLIFLFLAVSIFMCLYSNSGINKLLKQIMTISVYLCFSLILYKGKWSARIFAVIGYYVFCSVLDALTLSGSSLLLGLGFEELIMQKLTYVAIVTLDKLILLLFAWILYHFRPRKGLLQVKGKWLLLSVLFPLISVVMLCVLFYNSQKTTNLAVSVSVLIFGAILAVANCAMLYIISAIEKSTKQEQDMVLLRQQIALQSENYKSLRQSYSLQRQSAHEFERHIQTLHDLAEQSEFETVRSYLQRLRQTRAMQVFSISTNHPVFDVILNQKHQLALEQGIQMQVKVNDLSNAAIQTDALVVLLSNLLDNAIEACAALSERREIICSISLEDSLYVSIRNTSNPVDTRLETTKPDAANHGYGIPTVKLLLEELGAEYAFDYENGWFQFTAEVPL